MRERKKQYSNRGGWLGGLLVWNLCSGCMVGSLLPVWALATAEGAEHRAVSLPEGQKPWEGAGITAAWNTGDAINVVSGDKHWALDIRNPDSSKWVWLLAHRFSDYCGVWQEAGEVKPWGGSGVTAAWVNGNQLTLISKDRYWILDMSSPNPSHWRWEPNPGAGLSSPWGSAPWKETGGLRPWEGDGVTAGWVRGKGFTVVSVDKFWIFDASVGRWSTSGYFANNPVWSGAPGVGSGSQQPWEDRGITGAYVLGNLLAVLSVDKYWILDMSHKEWTQWKWVGSGFLKDAPLWSEAPVVRPTFVGWKPDCDLRLKDFSIFEYDGYTYLSAMSENNVKGLNYVRSKNLSTWEVMDDILPVRGSYDPDGVWAPHVFESEGTFYQYFTGAETVGPGIWDQSILLATTQDPSKPETWKKTDLVFRPTHFSAVWEPNTGAQCRDPMVLFAGDKWHLFYTGVDRVNEGTRGIIGRAEASSPSGPWTDKGAVLVLADGIPESVFVLEDPDGSYVMTFNHTGERPQGSMVARAKTAAGPFQIERPMGPGWAHEWLRASDGSLVAAFLTGRWINISRASWKGGRIVIE